MLGKRQHWQVIFAFQLAVQQPPEKRIKLVPPTTERIMIYVRQESEDAYTALHLVRPLSVNHQSIEIHSILRSLE